MKKRAIYVALMAMILFLAIYNYVCSLNAKSIEIDLMHGISTYIEHGQKLLDVVAEGNPQEYRTHRDMCFFVSGQVYEQLDNVQFSEREKTQYRNAILFLYSIRDIAFYLPYGINSSNGESVAFSMLEEYIVLLSEAIEQSDVPEELLVNLENNREIDNWIINKHQEYLVYANTP